MTQQAVPFPNPNPPQERRSNGLGLAGFIVSLVAFFTCFVLSPVGLLISFFGLFRRPRGFAFVGFVLGLVGTLVITVVFSIFGWGIVTGLRFGKPFFVTLSRAHEARDKILNYYATNGALPGDVTGGSIVAGTLDGWGRNIAYHWKSSASFELRSASQDGVFGTEDDYTEMFDVPARSGPEKP